MNKKGNKTVIGVFVVGALILLLVAIVVFGSGTYLNGQINLFCILMVLLKVFP